MDAPVPEKKPQPNQENTRLYVVISDDTVLILKMQYLHTFFILIIFVSIAVVFPVREISVKKPLQNMNGKDTYMVTRWTINLGESNSSYSD